MNDWAEEKDLVAAQLLLPLSILVRIPPKTALLPQCRPQDSLNTSKKENDCAPAASAGPAKGIGQQNPPSREDEKINILRDGVSQNNDIVLLHDVVLQNNDVVQLHDATTSPKNKKRNVPSDFRPNGRESLQPYTLVALREFATDLGIQHIQRCNRRTAEKKILEYFE